MTENLETAGTDVSDEELFASATSREPMAETPEAQPETPASQPTPSQSRDDQGRFAGNPAEPQAQPGTQQPTAEPEERPGWVPSSRHKAEADARRAAEIERDALRAQLQGSQQPQRQEPPATAPLDPLDRLVNGEGEAWAREAVAPVFRELKSYYSRQAAVQAHGEGVVSEAENALRQECLSGRLPQKEVEKALNNSIDPSRDILTWHEDHKARLDPQAHQRKQFEAFVTNPENREFVMGLVGQTSSPSPQAAQPASGGTVIKLPQSLNRTTSAASNAPGGDDQVSDADLFQSVTSRRR